MMIGDQKFQYKSTENAQHAQQMLDLLRNIFSTPVENATFFNFVNQSASITKYILDEYSHAKKIVNDYIMNN